MHFCGYVPCMLLSLLLNIYMRKKINKTKVENIFMQICFFAFLYTSTHIYGKIAILVRLCSVHTWDGQYDNFGALTHDTLSVFD